MCYDQKAIMLALYLFGFLVWFFSDVKEEQLIKDRQQKSAAIASGSSNSK
jgi:hypothetical protein